FFDLKGEWEGTLHTGRGTPCSMKLGSGTAVFLSENGSRGEMQCIIDTGSNDFPTYARFSRADPLSLSHTRTRFPPRRTRHPPCRLLRPQPRPALLVRPPGSRRHASCR